MVAANFAGSIVLFYYSDAFGYAMRNHVGHELMILHFSLTGYIFVLTMIGTDPLPRRAPYPMRLLLLLQLLSVPEVHQPLESKLQQSHRPLHRLLLTLPN